MRARAAWQFAELNIMKEIGSKNLTWQSLTRSRRPLKVRPRGDLCHPYRLNTVMQIYRQLHKAINVQLAKCSIKSNQIKSHHHAIKSTGLFSARLCKSRSDSSHALYRCRFALFVCNGATTKCFAWKKLHVKKLAPICTVGASSQPPAGSP